MWKRKAYFTKCIWTRMWKTFAEKNTDKMTRAQPAADRDKIQVGKKGNPMAKAERLCYTLL